MAIELLLRWTGHLDDGDAALIERTIARHGTLKSLFRAQGSLTAVVAVADRADADALAARLSPSPEEVEIATAVSGSQPASARSVTAATQRLPGLGDPFAMALVQWPAIFGLFELPMESWAHALRVLLGVWILGTVRAGFRSSTGALRGYGVGLLLNAVWATLAWRLWGAWYAWLAVLMLMMGLAAQMKMLADARTGESE